MASVTYSCFSDAGVTARWLPYAFLVCRASLICQRALLVSFKLGRRALPPVFTLQIDNYGHRVAFGLEFIGDLEPWRWFVDDGFEAISGTLFGTDVRSVLRSVTVS